MKKVFLLIRQSSRVQWKKTEFIKTTGEHGRSFEIRNKGLVLLNVSLYRKPIGEHYFKPVLLLWSVSILLTN